MLFNQTISILIMRKTLVFIILTLAFLMGASTPLFADKKDDKKKKGHPPVIIIVWEPAWSPVMREVSLPDVVDNSVLPFEVDAEAV